MTRKESARIVAQISTLITEGSVFAPVDEHEFLCELFRATRDHIEIDGNATGPEGTTFVLTSEALEGELVGDSVQLTDDELNDSYAREHGAKQANAESTS